MPEGMEIVDRPDLLMWKRARGTAPGSTSRDLEVPYGPQDERVVRIDATAGIG